VFCKRSGSDLVRFTHHTNSVLVASKNKGWDGTSLRATTLELRVLSWSPRSSFLLSRVFADCACLFFFFFFLQIPFAICPCTTTNIFVTSRATATACARFRWHRVMIRSSRPPWIARCACGTCARMCAKDCCTCPCPLLPHHLLRHWQRTSICPRAARCSWRTIPRAWCSPWPLRPTSSNCTIVHTHTYTRDTHLLFSCVFVPGRPHSSAMGLRAAH
jgi:hypothetical protein